MVGVIKAVVWDVDGTLFDYSGADRAGVAEHFAAEGLLCCEQLGRAKPDPSVFTAACSALSLAPAEVAYVGDDLRLDAIGARDAGLQGIWLDRLSAPSPVPAGVHRITGLDELPGLVAALGR
ncbi:hypothetical protein GCM10027589_33930 [Actinocorallia lasiicapitis]